MKLSRHTCASIRRNQVAALPRRNPSAAASVASSANFWNHRRQFSSDERSNNSTDKSNDQLLCDVVQGPSLLRTSHPRPNPSLLFLPGLRSLPFWTSPDYSRIAYGDPTVEHVTKLLEQNASKIRDEYLQTAPSLPSDYQDNDAHASLHQGSKPWKWHSYLNKGHVQGQFVQSFPHTATILQSLRNDGLLFEGTPFGFCFFSTLAGGSTIQAHTGPMNLRLRLHLPLIVPESDDNTNIGIRVGGQDRAWVPDKALVLDDSYVHQVWNHTEEERVLLLVDIWHPDVSPTEKQDIIQLFQQARLDGLWKR